MYTGENVKSFKFYITTVLMRKYFFTPNLVFTKATESFRFFSSLPGRFERPKKSNLNNLYFEVTDFNDFTSFKEKFFSYNLPMNNYTVYVKVRYDVDNFFMAGNSLASDMIMKVTYMIYI